MGTLALSRCVVQISCVGGSVRDGLILQVVDEGKNRAIQVEKEGFPDAVVWNPWIQKAAGMADFGDDQYKVGVHASAIHVDNNSNGLYLEKVHVSRSLG